MNEKYIYKLGNPEKLSDEDRGYWLAKAAFWGVIEDEAHDQRQDALKMIGMIETKKT